MSIEALEQLRDKAKVTHEDLAKRMGVTDEEYRALLTGKTRFRRLYVNALDKAALSLALELRDPSLLNPQFLWQTLRIAIAVMQEHRPPAESAGASESASA